MCKRTFPINTIFQQRHKQVEVENKKNIFPSV